MKELTLKLKIYQKFAAFEQICPLIYVFMGRYSQTVPGPKNVASPPLVQLLLNWGLGL